jgi:hypothetical protein
MTDDELFDLDDEDLDSDPFADVDTPAKTSVRTLEEFEAEVDKKIKILMSPRNDAKDRREAALWLGESGAPKAITALTKVYEKDRKNKKVQQAAAYALGQFKALDEAIIREDNEPVMEALAREENEGIVQLLEDIALRDERGKRLRIPTRTLVMIEGLLAVLLVILIALNMVLPGTRADQNRRLATRGAGTPAQRAVHEIGLRVDELEEDAETLQQQLNSARGGQALNCNASFKNPADFPLDTEIGTQYPQAKAVADRYNDLHGDFTAAKIPYNEACRASATISAENTTQGLAAVGSVLSAIPALRTEVERVRGEIESAVTATANAEAERATASVPTDIPTDAPTPTATPGLSTTDITRHAGAMINMVDQATGQRGFNTLLLQYWTDVRDNGTTIGCNAAAPTIPEDYALTEEEKALAPDLANAQVQLNTGLALVRMGWTLFTNACTNGTLSQNYQIGLDTSNNANATFDAALQILNAATGR